MSRTTILTTGEICYRSKNMELARAAAFARCIEGNASRFQSVEIAPAKSKNELYFVTFRPVSATKQGDMYEAEWNKNQTRADVEGEDFLYFRNADNPAVTFVFNPKSGETWEMFNGHCQCPHKLYRLTNAALSCKHELEKDRRIRLGIPMDGSDKKTRDTSPQAVAARADRIKATANLDF